MMAAETLTHDASTASAGAHLQLMRSLACELERAMRAIACNDLAELEDSVTNQQALSGALSDAADLLRDLTLARQTHSAVDTIDTGLMRQIREATEELNRLNLRYSILLKYSSRSVGMMAALFNSFRGQIQEASGPRLKHQTWSCRM